jgi:urease accessory protein
MNAPTLPLPAPLLSGQILPGHIRADGGVRIRFGAAGAMTKRLELHERGGYRARFPGAPGELPCEAVLINTGGGMAGGDRMRAEISLDADSSALVTTQAAEKIYRSQGSDTVVETHLALGAAARLDWLPQETILFSGGRLRRSLDVTMAQDAHLLACESLYFGRVAMGELLESGLFQDRWRIRRKTVDGRTALVFAEDVRLEGLMNLTLARKAVAAGARAIATVVILRPDAASLLDKARTALENATSECGVSAWNGILLARLLAVDAAHLRADLAQLITSLRGSPMPRSWQT